MALSSVERDPGSKPRPRSKPGIVIPGRFLPTDQVEWFSLKTAKGSLTRQLMERGAHRFQSIGGGDEGRRLPIVDGLEAFANPAVIADPASDLNHAKLTAKLAERLNEAQTQTQELRDALESMPTPDVDGKFESSDESRVEPAIERLQRIARAIPALERVVQTAARPDVVARSAARLRTVLFTDVDANQTTTSLAVRAQSHLMRAQQSVGRRQEAARAELSSYAASWAALGLLEANAQGALGDEVFVVNCSNPESLLAGMHSQLIELIGDKTDLPSLNILIAEPLRSLDSVHSLESYFDINATLLAGVYASFVGYSDPDELIDIAADYPRVGTVGAGSLWIHAGTALHRGLSCGVSGAVLGNRLANDERLDGAKRGYYGRLIPSFGSQPNKALFGLEQLDTEQFTKKVCAAVANSGINVVRRNRRNTLSSFSARTRSCLPDYSQIDCVRHFLQGLGEGRLYLEDEFDGELNDVTVQRMACDDVDKIVFALYRGVPGVSTTVTPAPDPDPTKFAIKIECEWPDPVQFISLKFARSFKVSGK